MTKKAITWLLLIVLLFGNVLSVCATEDTTDTNAEAVQEQTESASETDSGASLLESDSDADVQLMATSTSSISDEDVNDERYNSYLKAPFQYRNNMSEYISPNSGGLIIRNSDVYLPGRNGLDLELSTTYNSNIAYIYETCRGIDSDGDYINRSYSGTNEKWHYSLGIGWTFNIPYIRVKEYPGRACDLEIHMGSGETYLAEFSSTGPTYQFDEDEYAAHDISIVDYTDYVDNSYDMINTSDQTGRSRFALIYKDGRKEIFNTEGYLICIMDRFGNKIRYGYQTISFLNNHSSDLPYKIKDSLGRIVEIKYDSTDGKKVIIYLPDSTPSDKTNNSSVQYILGAIPGNTGSYAVTERIDQLQRPTLYSYSYQQGRFDYLNITLDDDPYSTGFPKNTFANMTGITYPTGASSSYTYGIFYGSQVRGFKEYYKIRSRMDTVYDPETNTNVNCNKEIYSYYNDPTGYPFDSPPHLRVTYTYNTTVATDTETVTTTATYAGKAAVSDTAKPIHYLKSVKKVVGTTKTGIDLRYVSVEQDSLAITIDGATDGETYEFTYESGKIHRTYTFNYEHLNVNEVVEARLGIGNQKLLRSVSQAYAYSKFPTTTETKIYNMEDDNYTTRTTSATYDSYGNVLTYTDERGNTATYSYYSSSDYCLPKKVSKDICDIDPNDASKGKVRQVTDYTLDTTDMNIETMVQKYVEKTTVNGSPVETVIKSITTNYTYGDSGYPGNLTKETVLMEDGTEVVTSYGYGADYNGTSYGHAYPTVVAYQVHDYDTIGQTARTIREYYTYDFYTGNKKSLKDGRGNITTYSYDALGRVTQVDNPPVVKSDGTTENSSVTVSYNDTSNYVDVTDEDLHTERQQFDGLGRLTKKQEIKDGVCITTETTHYNILGQVDWTRLEKSDTEKYKTNYQYDVLGRIIKTTNPDSSYITVKYGDALNKKTVTDEEGKTKDYYYDNADNLVKEVAYPVVGSTTKQYSTEYTYNYMGGLSKLLDANSKETYYSYDGFGRLVGVTNAKGENTAYKYDNLNNLVEQTIGDKTTKRTYDELGRMITEEYPGQRTEYFKYDDSGNMKYWKDRKGQVFNYDYDERNRLKNYKLGSTVIASYGYDKTGRTLWEENSSAGRTSYEYYGNGDIEKVTESDGRYISYQYDNLGNRTGMTDHFGKATAYGYDSRNRLKTITTGGKTTIYDYYLNGILKKVSYPAIVKEEYSYDGMNNLTSLKNSRTDGTTIGQYLYTYDGVGNQKSRIENGKSAYYGYDDMNRIQTVSNTDTTRPNPVDMIAAYTYDAEGNISSAFLSDRLQVETPVDFKVNELNQMVEYTGPDGTKTTYTYYPNGMRKTKTTKGVTTTYYYNGRHVIIEAENGNLKYRNSYGMNQIAREDAAGNAYYPLYNGHGDVVKLTDSAGIVQNTYEYDIYGKITNAVELGIPNPMRYSGQFYDTESGLYYLRARYYDPRVGRFISEDTNKGDINNPSSLNLYAYCWGNPLMYSDPSGNYPTPEGILKVGMAFGYASARLYIKTQNMISRAGEYLVEAGNFATMSADKVAAAKNAANAGKDKYNDGSSPNNPDPNKWNKKNIKVNYKISEFANDWQTKGFHLKIDGIEIAMRPGQNGTIVFKQVFSSTSSRAAQQSINKAYQLLQDPVVRQQFYERAINARDYLAKFGTDAATSKAGEINFLIKALEKLGVE